MNTNSQDIETVLVTGYAKAPQGTAMYEQYKHAGIVLEIDLKSHCIIDAEFTMVTKLAQRYFKKILIGYDLSQGVDYLVEDIKNYYLAPSVNSIEKCLRIAYQRYSEKFKLNN